MDSKRFFLFVTVSITVLFSYSALIQWLYPQPERPVAKVEDKARDGGRAGVDGQGNGGPADDDPAKVEVDGGDADGGSPAANDDATGKSAPNDNDQAPRNEVADNNADVATDNADAADGSQVPFQRVVLGSLDPQSGTRMAVVLVNRGAAVERIELAARRYRDLDDETGYLGHLAPSDALDGGAKINIVVPGSPADEAGLQVGDVISTIDKTPITSAASLIKALAATEPAQKITIGGTRDDSDGGKAAALSVSATLRRRPLEVVRPELGTRPLEYYLPGAHDQLSFLMTLERVGDKKLLQNERELDGVHLLDDNWQIDNQSDTEVTFSKEVAALGLTVVKRYELAKVPTDELEDEDYPAYHLVMDLEIRNNGSDAQEISYRLDGPTGLPTEGWWYSRKIGRSWRGMRLRDIALHSETLGAQLFDASKVVDENDEGRERKGLMMPGTVSNRLAYIGVDAIYFSSILIPQNLSGEQWFSAWEGLQVGNIPEDKKRRHLTNVTSRAISLPFEINAGAALEHSFVVFAGPKRPGLLGQYEAPAFPKRRVTLKELIYYGWPIWAAFAGPLAWTLHMFHSIVGNFGVAIIMLTVLVRLCMFPLSRKQAINAQKMQELQPEMKRLTEKYKNEPEKRLKAILDLYKKHNHNPLSGCLPLFIQLPIFIGLYRTLMVDIELRQAPLIGDSIRWASNLGAPDMFLRWDGWMPAFLASETGWLGPYLNILPLITVVLFIWQQKMFMPPPTDEQAAMQQKIMQYMMVFFGFLFFTVPSGLCLYFIVSSLWGVGERKLLPKAKETGAKTTPETSKKPELATVGSGKAARSNGNPGSGQKGSGKRKRKRR